MSAAGRGTLLLVLGALAGCGMGTGTWSADGGADLSMIVTPSDGSGSVLFAGILFSGCPQVAFGPPTEHGTSDAGFDAGLDAGSDMLPVDAGTEVDAGKSGGPDGGLDGAGAKPDGGLDGGAGWELPRCIGTVPLQVTLVPLAPPGSTSWQWTLPGGTPLASQASSPSVSYTLPGIYPIGLVIGSAAGEASAQAEIEVRPAALGAPCGNDAQCAPGLSCLCAPGSASGTDGGADCPPELRLCTRGCAGGGCGPDEVCVDLSRSTHDSPQTAGAPWRRPLCLPACTADADCGAGTACRELPTLVDGDETGGSLAWQTACFAPVLGDVGDACIDANGLPAPSECLGGACLALGARNLCSSLCDNAPCPSNAACATFHSDPTHPACLPRCDAQHPCGDPLLGCQPARSDDANGFDVPASEPTSATYCAPRRCVSDADCAPAGTCHGLRGDGGVVGDGGTAGAGSGDGGVSEGSGICER